MLKRLVPQGAFCGVTPTRRARRDNSTTAQQDGSDDAEEAVDGEKDNDEVDIEMD